MKTSADNSIPVEVNLPQNLIETINQLAKEKGISFNEACLFLITR